MKRTFCYFILLLAATSLNAQNVGINTTTPGSTLSINGSVSAAFNAVTTNYTLTATDYVVVYNGTANATFTLPPALAAGSGNYKGRVYKIKNNSAFELTVDPTGIEQISGQPAALVIKGNTLELISTGLTSGNTWEALSGMAGDGIRKVLEYSGCSSCPAYDLAGVNTWVQITGTEYSLMLTALAGTAAYGAPAATMNMPSTAGIFGATTYTQNFTAMSQMPAAYYPVALSIKTSFQAPANMSNLNFKLSNTGQSSGYNTFASVLPTVSSPAAHTIYYFVLKRPTLQSPTGAPSNMAVYTSATAQLGNIDSPVSTNLFYGNGNTSNPGDTRRFTSLFQVLATAVKSW